MSGLLERIVRRRRATAGRRLDPTHTPEADAAHQNGHAGAGGNGTTEEAVRALHAAGPEAARAGTETEQPAAEAPPPISAEPGFRERGRMRRRARYLRQLREVQLRDLGGFVLELHRFDQERPELVKAKLEGAASTDAELRALEHALGFGHTLRELRLPGIGGACPVCGSIYGSDDRFCASCGEPLQEEDIEAERDPIDLGQVYPE